MELRLLPRKTFELVHADGSVTQGQFGTWALARFGQKKKIGLAKIMEVFEGDVQILDLMEILLCAIEYKERENNKPPQFNDIKLSRWIDDYIAETGKSGVLMEILNHLMMDETGEEKKTGDQLSGVNSSELSTAVA